MLSPVRLSMRRRLVFHLAAVSHLLLCLFVPGIQSSRVVTLKSVQFFTTHSWMSYGASVYFSCNKEKTITLHDVLTVDQLYTYNGKESWQPLTVLPADKCKRCGFYETDPVTAEAFDEWELCPANFLHGEYFHYKENEFNASFSCPECNFPANFTRSSGFKEEEEEKKHRTVHTAVVVVTSLLASILVISGLVSGFLWYQKKKRDEEDRARFLKMFEVDDMEDELGISRII